jgi:DNA-directed RNA polymerase specialized sigma24 family protein
VLLDLELGIGARGAFPPTRWSLILRARELDCPGAGAALAELCSIYWYPVYALIRRKGNNPDRSLDLTQGYFTQLLEKDKIAVADRNRGRFRSFLRVDCVHFLVDEYRRRVARKDTVDPFAVNAKDAEDRYRFEPCDEMTPDRIFDRAWALTLLDQVMGLLGDEYATKGRTGEFERLKIVLTQGRGSIPIARLASEFGKTEGAVHVAVHRLRRRYREILIGLISETLDDPAEIQDEIRSLFRAIRS